jgi:uncharacterized protein YqcC (DUF446 family)
MGLLDSLRRSLGDKKDDLARLAALAPAIDALETELRRLGCWQSTPIEPEKLQFRAAFGMDTMAFSQWLQFVFVPAARSMLAGERALPPSSMLAAHAVREFDGYDEAGPLCEVLCRIDVAVNGGGQSRSRRPTRLR